MPPPPRYAFHHRAIAGRWYIYDRFLSQRISVAVSMQSAGRLASDYEAAWRSACERWRREEHREE